MSEFLELVKSRRSVRTFDGQALDNTVVEDLKSFAQSIVNPYGIPVRFEFLDADEHKLSSPVLAGEKLYVSAVVAKGEHAEEAYGYAFEALLMHAHEMGLGTVWIGGTMPRDKFENATGLADGEVMPCVSPLGKEAKKMSVKEALMRKGVKADSRFDFEELFFVGDFGTAMTPGKAMEAGLRDALESVRLAPSAVNKQPWRVVIGDRVAHFYEKHDKGYITPDYDLQKIDIGIAMYHFEQELLAEGRTPKCEISDPGILVPADVDYVASFRW
ncbi:MAG: nitroreductase family protein [Butyrivibrio sp.]|nr:nitroreductase family protein [Butyrivibrio sp.]